MNIQFGQVDYVCAKTRRRVTPQNEEYFTQLSNAVTKEIIAIDERENLALGVWAPDYLNCGGCCGNEKTSKSKGFLGKMVTGPDALKMLEVMGIKVNPNEPKAIIEQKIFDGVRKRYKKPDMSAHDVMSILAGAVENYTKLHEASKKPINRIYLKV